MRTLICLICGLVISTAAVSAAEQILISGGCALTFNEKNKPAPHDRYWGNFIDAALVRMNQIRPTLNPGDQLTWLVYRPSYLARSKEDNVNLLSEIQAKAAKANAKLMWFDTANQLINYVNRGQNRDQVKITRFEYFGHSNMLCFLFDYSNDLSGAAPDYGILHQNDLRKLDRDSFDKTAYAKSWGCHSGESYSAEWQRCTGVPMVGAIGKTDYSNGGLPFLSTPNGQWTQ